MRCNRATLGPTAAMRCLGGKFLHSNRCRDDCDGLEGLVRIADHLGPDPGTNCLDDHLGTLA